MNITNVLITTGSIWRKNSFLKALIGSLTTSPPPSHFRAKPLLEVTVDSTLWNYEVRISAESTNLVENANSQNLVENWFGNFALSVHRIEWVECQGCVLREKYLNLFASLGDIKENYSFAFRRTKAHFSFCFTASIEPNWRKVENLASDLKYLIFLDFCFSLNVVRKFGCLFEIKRSWPRRSRSLGSRFFTCIWRVWETWYGDALLMKYFFLIFCCWQEMENKLSERNFKHHCVEIHVGWNKLRYIQVTEK